MSISNELWVVIITLGICLVLAWLQIKYCPTCTWDVIEMGDHDDYETSCGVYIEGDDWNVDKIHTCPWCDKPIEVAK